MSVEASRATSPVHPDEHILKHVIHLVRGDASREKGSQLGCGLLPELRLVHHAQHSGLQQREVAAGFVASIVAEATNFSIPGIQDPTIAALWGAIRTSMSANPAALNRARTSSMGAAPATQPA